MVLAVKAEKRKLVKGVQKMLWARMKERGYSDISAFMRASGLEDAMSFETLRRSLNDEKRPVSPLSIGVIMQRLGFSNREIIDTMKDLGDTYVYSLITDDSSQSEPWEEAMVGVARKLMASDPKHLTHVAALLKVVTDMAGVDAAAELSKLVPAPRTRAKAKATGKSVKAEQPAEEQAAEGGRPLHLD
jgi:hypothetical protein